ncbi:MAG: lysoplasmalogenase [Deltaproteobacteria bacterium]|nr:lysoplasmalogenase [Deltaproteobacteria bacterium]
MPHLSTLFSLITVVSVALLLAVTRRGPSLGERVLKPLASTAFIAAALAHGAHRTPYGAAILAGLAFSWWGDVLLISRAKRVFLAGLVAFLLGHVAYSVAFARRGVSVGATALALLLLLGPLVLVGRWLLPSVEARMRAPVLAYMAVITVMVALAVGTVAAHGEPWVLVGAVAFYLSDLSVARDRFIAPGWNNKLWGWPLYFGAQLVLAWCAGRP